MGKLSGKNIIVTGASRGLERKLQNYLRRKEVMLYVQQGPYTKVIILWKGLYRKPWIIFQSLEGRLFLQR